MPGASAQPEPATRPELLIPIDIKDEKLLGWLVDRGRVPEDWREKVKAVRAKIDAALDDMPDVPEVVALLSGTYIDFDASKRVLELLKKSKEGGKNWYGGHTSKYTANWQAIVDAYNQNGAYLGEYGEMVMHSANFDIPNLKKQLVKLQASIPKLQKKRSECTHLASTHRKAFKRTCKELGIAGQDVEEELRGLSKGIPELYEEVGAQCAAAGISATLEYYRQFALYAHQRSGADALPTLTRIAKHGVSTADASGTSGGGGIDFGDAGGGIDFGDDGGGIDFGDDGGGIDFGDDGGGIDFGDDGGATIDWGVDAADASAPSPATEEAADSGGAVNLGESQMRNALIDDLLELEAFLEMRAHELRGGGEEADHSAPQAVASVDKDAVRDMSAAVSSILERVNGASTRQLIMLSSSSKFVERMAKTIRAKNKCADTMEQRAKGIDGHIEKVHGKIAMEQPKLAELLERTRRLKRTVEAALSLCYDGRTVNIIGNINTLLR